MHGEIRTAWALHSAGTVHRVDTVNRELTVFVNGELQTFDVPVGCEVVLHGEPVKLRMVQPRDRVRITQTSRGIFRVALRIEVQPDELPWRAATPRTTAEDDKLRSALKHERSRQETSRR